MKKNIKALAALMTIVFMLSLCACKKKDNKGDNEAANAITKKITLIVVDDKQKENKFDIQTSREMLGDALLDEKLVEGTKGQYGLYINTVNGLKVNEENEEWWCLTKGGESVMTGVDSTPIADGDVFEFTFTVGY